MITYKIQDENKTFEIVKKQKGGVINETGN